MLAVALGQQVQHFAAKQQAKVIEWCPCIGLAEFPDRGETRKRGDFKMKAHLLVALLIVCILPSIASPQTAEEIIERNIAAREEANWGGRGSSVLRTMRPDRMRFDYTWQGGPKAPIIPTTSAFDGKAGWWADQHKGLQTPHTVTGDTLEELREQAQKQFAQSLSELQANGNKVEFVGKDAAQGKSCYKIRFTTHTGHVRYAYYDAESFLIVQTEQEVFMKNKKEELLTTTIIIVTTEV